MNTKFFQIETEITQIKKENLKQRNDIEELTLCKERQLDTLINDVIQNAVIWQAITVFLTRS